MSKKRIFVGITGASGAIYGVRLIKALKSLGHEVHLVISKWGAETLTYETGLDVKALIAKVDKVYDENDQTAGP
ncbi:MAG: flavoprotein, partial [Candidatus Thorarchaeota archaeon]